MYIRIKLFRQYQERIEMSISETVTSCERFLFFFSDSTLTRSALEAGRDREKERLAGKVQAFSNADRKFILKISKVTCGLKIPWRFINDPMVA